MLPPGPAGALCSQLLCTTTPLLAPIALPRESAASLLLIWSATPSHVTIRECLRLETDVLSSTKGVVDGAIVGQLASLGLSENISCETEAH